MKATCPQCGRTVQLTEFPAPDSMMQCSGCLCDFNLRDNARLELAGIHVTDVNETFVVEWEM